MMSMEEMFYGQREDVWIVKPEKKEKDDGKKAEAPPKPPPPTAQETSFGPFYPFYHRPYTAPADPAKKPSETKNVELKVPICCEACIEAVTTALKSLKGVKKVNCDILTKKVTVVVATTENVDDILLECRKVFRKSRWWTKDD